MSHSSTKYCWGQMHRGLPYQNLGWAMANLAHTAAPPMADSEQLEKLVLLLYVLYYRCITSITTKWLSRLLQKVEANKL